MHAPAFDLVADLDTPVSAYRKLGPLKACYLLESVEGGERLGRYSFIGFGDARTVTCRAGDSVDVLAQLRGELAAAPALAPDVPGLPFRGGLVGAAAFGLLHRFDRVRTTHARPAEAVDARYIAASSLLVFDHLTRRAAVLHAGPETERQALRTEVIARLRAALPPSSKRGVFEPPVPDVSPAGYAESVRRAQGHIQAGDVFQLVLSIGFEGACDLDPFEVYRALRLLNPSPYLYYCDFGDLQLAGSSPEALVRLEGDVASLRPIAGTRPRGATPEADEAHLRELLADPKEHAEHVMLVDLARNDLGRVARAGSIRVAPYRTVERYSHVMHTVSGVSGRIRAGLDAFDLFAGSFPAGTVVGAPKVRAAELIDTLEARPRGFYAGTVGYFGQGGGCDHAIAIRTLVFEGGRYRYQAGAGIVADSQPEAEYAEVLAKARVMSAALELAREGL